MRFADAELETRRQLGYPPFVRCIAVWVGSEDESKAESACRSLAGRLRNVRPTPYRLLGPRLHPSKGSGAITAGIFCCSHAVCRLAFWHWTTPAAIRSLRSANYADVDPAHLL